VKHYVILASIVNKKFKWGDNMQAVILAAGMGKRLKELTKSNTKCMVKVNDVTLIERMLRILDKKNLSKIVIVVGYQKDNLIEYINTLNISTPVCLVHNDVFDRTNNIYSLLLAKEYLLVEDTLLLESDLIFEESAVDLLLQDSRETLALVDRYESWMDGTCMVLDETDCIVDFVSGKNICYYEKEKYYKTVNIYKFSKHFLCNTYIPFLEAYTKAMGYNEYYESVIKLIAMLETKEIRAKRLEGQKWYEIDDVQDLDIAETLFNSDIEGKYKAFSQRYGGYWRYPKVLDYCYLVNPYYPSGKMLEEITVNFNSLITAYPSGMRVNVLLASKYFEVCQEYIVVGNGAAELINVLMKILRGKIGFIRPTFEEYPNRYELKESVYMHVDNENFSYSAETLIEYFGDKDICSLVLINPDNPSGNYINMHELLKLLEWSRKKHIRLIIDESFVDFVECDKYDKKLSLIDMKILEKYRNNLVVVKSVSKAHGVPGIRLGVIASGDCELIGKIKENLPIWNINSFGEYYLQIADKYKCEFREALQKFYMSRTRFMKELEKIYYLRVIPSQSNYFMCEVLCGKTSMEIAGYLLENHIFIKDLTPKINDGKQYIRIAIKKEGENELLIHWLRKYE